MDNKINYNFIDISGQRFGRLIAIEYIGHKGWLCKCDCGGEKIAVGSNLRGGRTKSCGCLARETARSNGKNSREKVSLPFGENSFNSIFRNYKRGARIRNLSFELTKEQFKEITRQNCKYCGSEPKQSYYQGGGNGEYIYNGVDRIDNSIGYIINNVVPCCKDCNIGKGTKTKEEFLEWINRVYEYSIRSSV